MPQNTADVIASRRATVAQLYLQGWTQQRIAEKVNVERSQISNDLDAIRKDWQESTVFDFNEAKIQELAKIDNLESVAWQAWFDSMRPIKKKSTKMKGDVPDVTLPEDERRKQKPKALETYETTEERLPDPRYLQIVDRQIERRCKILGLDAPIKYAETDRDGNNVKRTQTWIIKDHTGGHEVPEPDQDY